MEKEEKLYKLQGAIELVSNCKFFYSFEDFIYCNREDDLLENESVKDVIKEYEPEHFILQSNYGNSCCILDSIEDVFSYLDEKNVNIFRVFEEFFDNL